MFLGVRDIACAFLYYFINTTSGPLMYLCVEDIEFVYLYDFPVISKEWSYICVLRILNVSS